MDGCFKDTPTGKEKTIGGPARVLDPGRNTKLDVDYRFMGVVKIRRAYWFLDHADDYSWFISADPAFEKLWIFTRDPQIGAAQRQALVERAKGFGYDITKLEFPAQPAR